MSKSRTVSLVLDEAAVVEEWIGKKANVDAIHRRLSEIAECPRLIVAGTRVDVETTGLSSVTDVRKYWMKQLGAKEVAAAIDKKGVPGDTKERLMSIVQNQALYRKLATNARSASYLIDELRRVATWGSELTSASGVIQMVVRRYIAQNGLKNLSRPERRVVAREVYQALQASSERRGQA